MLEKYYKYKINYKDYIVIIKCGSFYETLGNDALIINKLFGYKVKKLSNTFKAGFPCSNIDKITNMLDNKKINYIVVDENSSRKRTIKNNKYIEYIFDLNKLELNSIRIDRIYTYLKDMVLSDDISSLLDKIEALYE